MRRLLKVSLVLIPALFFTASSQESFPGHPEEAIDHSPMISFDLHDAQTNVISSTLDATVLEVTVTQRDSRLPSSDDLIGLGLVAVAHSGRIQASVVEVEAVRLSRPDEIVHLTAPSSLESVVRLGRPGIWRDLRVVEVAIVPCWPIEDDIAVVRHAVIHIENVGGTGINEKTRQSRPVSPTWEQLYRRHVLNYDAANLSRLSRGTGKRYIVISRSRFDSQTPQFTGWKTRQGYGTQLVRLEDLGYSDPEQTAAMEATKNHILNVYNTWPETPEYVLLVGDIFDYSTGKPGSIWTKQWLNSFYPEYYQWAYYDQWYAFLEGDDVFADVMLGRFPDSNADRMDYLFSKSVWYEKQPYINGSWQKRAIMTLDTYQEQETITTKTQISNLLSDWGMTVSNHLNSNFSGILSAINQGVTFYNYRGHYCDAWYWGSTFDGYDVPYVNNTKKIGVWTVLSCESAAFHGSSSSTAELMLRRDYTDPSNPKGAVAFIGSQAYTSYLYNNPLDKGFYYAWTDSGSSILGSAFLSAKQYAWDHTIAYGDSGRRHSLMREYTILGDPSVQVWTDVPTAMTVTTDPTTVPVGPSTNMDISVTTTTRAPIPGALVCLWKGTEVYIYGYTNTAGSITLPVQPTTEGTVKLTVTAYNHIPHLSDIPATSGGGIPQAPVADAQAIGNHLRLTWAPVTQDLEGAPILVDHYNVYRNTVAHYAVSGASFLGSTDSSPYDDLNVVGNPSVNYFYRIVAISEGGQASPPSDPTGEFDFDTE
jgi:hypothetical protein